METGLNGTRFKNVMQSLILEAIFSVILAAGKKNSDLKKTNTRDASVLFWSSHLIIVIWNDINMSFFFFSIQGCNNRQKFYDYIKIYKHLDYGYSHILLEVDHHRHMSEIIADKAYKPLG